MPRLVGKMIEPLRYLREMTWNSAAAASLASGS
jgi:hypothetical protein